MTREEFREQITRLGFNPASFTRRLQELGDPRGTSTIQRNITNYLSGTSDVPGLMFVVLELMRRTPGKSRVITRGRGRPRRYEGL